MTVRARRKVVNVDLDMGGTSTTTALRPAELDGDAVRLGDLKQHIQAATDDLRDDDPGDLAALFLNRLI